MGWSVKLGSRDGDVCHVIWQFGTRVGRMGGEGYTEVTAGHRNVRMSHGGVGKVGKAICHSGHHSQ